MDKPTGQVTFLFTDIEGSTKLSQKFPDTLPSALEVHDEILHEAIESNNGFVFKIAGDAYCAAESWGKFIWIWKKLIKQTIFLKRVL